MTKRRLGGVGALATGVAVVGATGRELTPANPWLLAVVLGALLLTELRHIPWLRAAGAGFSPASVGFAAALLFLLPGYTAGLVAAGASLLAAGVRRRGWAQRLVDASIIVLSMTAATAVLRATGAQHVVGRTEIMPMTLVGIALALAVLYVLDGALGSTVVALDDDQPLAPSIVVDLRQALLTDGVLLALAPVLVLVGDQQPLLLPFALLLTLAVHRSARDAAERAHDAVHDPLTGLANRRLFDVEAEAALERASRTATHPALLLIDLDRFKEVNDTYGHAAGDAVLCAVTEALCRQASSGATIARLGGDEFAVLLPGSPSASAAEAAGAALAEVFPVSVSLPGRPPVSITVDASVGCATRLTASDGVGDLLRAADEAMYAAKRTLTRFATSPRLGASRDLLADLDRALASRDGQLVLEYQPIIDLQSRAITTFEALIRWDHPQLGRLRPAEFLPLVEASPLIEPFTDTVIAQATAFLAEVQASDHRVGVAVNVSARNLLDPAFVDRLEAALVQRTLGPGLLTVEVTETALIDDLARSCSALARLDALGVPVVLDDFGAGLSSLARLRDLPVTGIKIDRAFLAGPDDLRSDRLLVTLVGLGHAMGLQVTAEGVETDQQLAAVEVAGCDRAQGYRFGHPRPADQAIAWLAGRQSAPIATTVPHPPGVVRLP